MTGLEQRGAFKMLGPLFRKFQNDAGVQVKLRDVRTIGDKDARIRSYLQAPLAQGKVYATEGPRHILQQELDMFPGGKRKDALDAASMCQQMKLQPSEPLRRQRFKKFLRAEKRPTSTATGY
jgi:hypothetical protein